MYKGKWEVVAVESSCGSSEASTSSRGEEQRNSIYFRSKMGLAEVSGLISEFTPENMEANMTPTNWVENIENLKDIYGWSDRETLFYATLRLKGAAKKWLQGQQKNVTDWEQFKTKFVEGFPTVQDEANILMQIMNRGKRDNECIENYFYDIVYLGKKINMSEKSLIKYIISGLTDRNLINMLTVGNCQTVKDVLQKIKAYEEIGNYERQRRNFSKYENDQLRDRNHSGTFRDNRRPQPYRKECNKFRMSESRADEQVQKQGIKCFKCKANGHYARDCPDKDSKVCYECRKPGHIAKDCSKRKEAARISRLHLNEAINEYYKNILIKGREVNAFLDLGSDITTIQDTYAKRIKLNYEPCSAMLIGFGGGQSYALGKTKESVKLDNVEQKIEIFIVDDVAQHVPMIIGKNFLDKPGIRVIKTVGKYVVEKEEAMEVDNNKVVNIKIEDLKIDASANENANELLELINFYRNCFSTSIDQLGKTDLIEMKIKVQGNKTIRCQPYKVPYGLKEPLRKQIQELLENDIIQLSESLFASPVILIPKKTGEHRMCVDYRKLNAITERECFPTPNIEETLNSLTKKCVFTSLDLMSGYYQVPIAEECRHLTAFITPEGHYEFKRVPFGLTNSPAVFMRLMAKVIHPIKTTSIISYMDDVLVATTTVVENIVELKKIFKELQKAGLTLNLKKCVFFQKTINFLGHEISKGTIKPGAAKIRAVSEYKQPKTVKEVRQFLGLCGYFRRFVLKFSEITLPLTKLLKKNTTFQWTDEADKAFNKLKGSLTNRPVLTLFDEKSKHEVHTDASSHGISGILMQEEGNGLLKPVSYFSRTTTEAEAKYHSYELEALAVVESLERFKHYLLQRKFKVITDCNSLKQTQEKKQLVPRIARWWLKIMEYDFDLVFRPGTKMAHADALSRAAVEVGQENEPVVEKMMIIGIPTGDWLSTLQGQDKRLQEIKDVLLGTDKKNLDQDGIKGNYLIKENRVYKKTDSGEKFVIPNGIRWRVIKAAHDDMGHCGFNRTLENIKKYFWFSSMKPVTKKYVDSCIECLYNKKGNDENKVQLHVPELKPIPFHKIHIDHLGPIPASKRKNMYVVGIVDSFTKFVVLKATTKATTRPVIRMLQEISQYFGLPTMIVTDRGSAFTAKEFENYCKDNDIKHIRTTVKTPRSNGQIERYFRTVKDAIMTMTKEQNGRDWDDNLNSIQWALNTMKHSTTKATPQEVLMSYKPRHIMRNKLILALTNSDNDNEEIPLNELRTRIMERIVEKAQKQVEKHNNSHLEPHIYKKGDLVLIRQEPTSTGQPTKLQPRYRGPYQIEDVLSNDRYLIRDSETTQLTQKPYSSVHSAERIKPWCKLTDLNFDDEDEQEDKQDD